MTVQIVHHKSSAYVAAEGSFATGQLSKDGECYNYSVPMTQTGIDFISWGNGQYLPL